MPDKEKPSPEELQKQIDAYRAEFSHYECFAKALRRVLEAACKTHLREAIVQARAKDVSSFAEKCVRKFKTYPDAVHQMNDLCGGRIIVQTQSLVESARRFVEQNFTILENEDVGMRLGEKEFGYRDRHYIVRLKPACAEAIGFTADEIAAIGDRRAELQIRTWPQHTWADTLHDRTYKSPFKLTLEASRTAALLAALMEGGDRNFDRLATELDGLVANYATYAERAKVEEEIALQQLLFNSETEPENRTKLALVLSRLRAALGQHQQVITLIDPLKDVPSPMRDELHLELGTALCRLHGRSDKSGERGRDILEALVDHLERPRCEKVLNLRCRASLRAKAFSRLGWSYEVDERRADKAKQCHARALELEPTNPYYLANMLGFELRAAPVLTPALTNCLKPMMLAALGACESHAAQKLELPFAFFTAGRLRLLLDQPEAALQDYLRGAHHCLDRTTCGSGEVIEDEIAWLHRVTFGQPLPEPFQFAKDFLLLARDAETGNHPKRILKAAAEIREPVLIIAGGAASIGQKALEDLRGPLTEALKYFHGTVISGGTRSGVPGLIGDIAEELQRTKARNFQLVGYRPENLPDDAPKDDRYDKSIRVGGNRFSAAQILANWIDILAAGINPGDVQLLGLGGGAIAAIEYRMALAMGASVGVLQIPKAFGETPDAADNLLSDLQWRTFTNLLPLPFDAATIRAFIAQRVVQEAINDDKVLDMAKEFHAHYLAQNTGSLPENKRPWPVLPATYQRSNLAQAAYAVEILRAVGFGVRAATGAPDAIKSFGGDEFKADVERMAELEHGRWNIERLREAWRPGKIRDNEKHIHPCITVWDDDKVLTKEIKDYDRNAILAFPAILAKAGLEIFREPEMSRT